MSQPAWPWAHLPSTRQIIFSESLLREDLSKNCDEQWAMTWTTVLLSAWL